MGTPSTPAGGSAALSAELQAKLARRLAKEWEELNWQLFGNRMRRPTLELVPNRGVLGRWRARDRNLSLSLPAVLSTPWLETVETLKHEMAHQFVDEILGGEKRPHGPAFREVCRARGIDPSATGSLDSDKARDQVEDRIITKVRKLLALADSSNQHEAELAAATAQRLMLKFNIDLQSSEQIETETEYQHLWVGKPSGRVPAHERALGALLTEHFFVEGIWVPVYRPLEGKAGTVLELCGRPENLQMAEFVHAFMLRTVERLWKQHKRERGISSNRDRRTFLAGAIAGFDAKLSSRESEAQQQGLIWVRDAKAQQYLGRRYPKTVRTGYRDHRGSEAFAEGHKAGGNITLSRPVERGGNTRGPKALGPGK